MNEKALLFGEAKSLVGVVTDPPAGQGADEPRLAFVILNAGIVHHVGPNRIHVKLARRLAGSGFVAMRFDFSGIGDSLPRFDGKPFAASALEEIGEALDYLESSRGVRRFVLVGICSGADNALRAGASDPRVVGAVAIEGHAIPTATYLWRSYRARLLRPRSWRRLLSGESELWTELTPAKKEPAAPRPVKLRAPSPAPAARRQILDSMRAFEARGARLLLVYSAGSASHAFYVSNLRRRIARLRRNGTISTRFVNGADHVFTHAATQDELLSTIFGWADELGARDASPFALADA